MKMYDVLRTITFLIGLKTFQKHIQMKQKVQKPLAGKWS